MTLTSQSLAPLSLADATLDELRAALAPEVARNAAFDGWTHTALIAAADTLGVDHDVAALAFAGDAVAMIDAWFADIDRAMGSALPPEKLATLKVRQRIAALVEARLDLLLPEREALRRALAILALPQHVRQAARLGWRAADRIWRTAGDTATDYNHYSKRALLAGAYGATLLVFLDDESEGCADSRAFLARRLDGIVRFGQAKAKWLRPPEQRFSVARFVGRLRYPAGS